MKLHRPYIPIAVRVKVAERQLGVDVDPSLPILPLGKRLRSALLLLFGDAKVALDHDPALVNRRQYQRRSRGKLRTFYDPSANDPRHLIYREAGFTGSDHDIKTRVRGDGAQLSDLAIVRKRKRKARKVHVTPIRGRVKVGMRVTGAGIRGGKIVSANRWPPKGARKINWGKP